MSSFVITIDVSALTLNKVYDQPFWSGTQRYISIPSGPKCKLVIHNHSGNFLQFNLQGSGRGFCIQANGLSDPVELADNDSGITYQPYAQATGYPAAWQPNMLMLVLYSPGEKPITVGNGAGFNVPAAIIGPGALPEGVTIGANDIVNEPNETLLLLGNATSINPILIEMKDTTATAQDWMIGFTRPTNYWFLFDNINARTVLQAILSTGIIQAPFGFNSGNGGFQVDGSGNILIAGQMETTAANMQIILESVGAIFFRVNATAGDLYITTGVAFRMYMDGAGNLVFQAAVSGTAGTAITWITKWLFDVNGHLTIGNIFPRNVQTLFVGAQNDQGNSVALIQNSATANQNADILDISRTVNSAGTYRHGIDAFPSYYIYDINNANYAALGVAALFNSPSRGPIVTMNTNGGGNNGRHLFVGTTDPGGNAIEGDWWCGA